MGQWALINSLSGRSKLHSCPRATLEDLTSTFESVVTDPCRPPLLQPAPTPISPTLTCFEPVTELEVQDQLSCLNSAKSAGSDGLSPAFLKRCSESLAPSLTSIVNESLATGEVPDLYKVAHVCPVYKSGEQTLATNYRPISLLPVVSKLLEKFVHRQLTRHIQRNIEKEFLPHEQFAYRAQHSCEDALALAIDRWNCALDRGQLCGVVLADMSKAFDRVVHQTLVECLQEIEVNYLSNRHQMVKMPDALGQKSPCTRGVPQGSVLGPLLFCIYIRKVSSVFTHSVCQIYADDICFYYSGDKAADITNRLTKDLNNLDAYLSNKGLLLNPNKTQFLLLHRASSSQDQCSISCRGVDIKSSPMAKYLGLLIDETLSFKDQVEHVCDTVHKKLGAFRHGRRNLSHAARRMFYLSVLQSTLDYASSAYCHCLSQSLYNRLVVCSHNAMKKTFGAWIVAHLLILFCALANYTRLNYELI